MKQKISSRILIVLISVVMLITALPLNSLTAFADEYTGSGSGSAVVDGISNSALSMSGDEYGVRLYAITKDGGIKAGETYSAVDLWYDKGCIQGKYSTSCRFGNITNSKIYKHDFTGGVSAANKALKDAGKLEGSNAISAIPKFAGFEYGDPDFYMSGVTFRGWATSKVKTKDTDVWNVVALYHAITGVEIIKDEYLVIEPIMCLPVVKGTYPNGMYYDGHYAGTWYGYMKRLGNNSGGTMMNIKAAWGNGFVLDKAKADLSVPGRYTRSTYYSEIGSKGWGLHVLQTTDGFGGHGDPIDSYDINNNPSTPALAETPKTKKQSGSYDNTGNVTIVKTYVDLYMDANSAGYTQAIDKGTFIQDGCSNLVVISDEKDKTGYEVKAWYTSKSVPLADAENYKGSSMITVQRADSIKFADKYGDINFGIRSYDKLNNDTIICNGSKSYNMKYTKYIDNDGDGKYDDEKTFAYKSNYITDGKLNPKYTRTKALSTRLKDTDEQHVELADTDRTIVILYTRVHGWIDSEDGEDGSTTYTTTNDKHKELKIVKCYGSINPVTYEVATEKTERWTSKSRNVHMTSEDGYRLAEYVYCPRDNNGTSYKNIDAETWCNGTVKNPDIAYNLKGFIDGFGSESYQGVPFGSGNLNLVRKRPYSDTASVVTNKDWGEYVNSGSLNSYSTNDFVGTYGKGRRSGKDLNEFNHTIYFGGVGMKDPDNTSVNDDTLYILFLKEDELKYEATDFVIPESYITRHNDFATNKISVVGTNTGKASYLFQQHKFQYTLPFITYGTIYDWPDAELVACLTQEKTNSTGLISKWAKMEWMGKKSNTATLISRLSTDKRYQMAYSTESRGGIVSFSNANYNYVAYRSGDKPTVAKWKYDSLTKLLSNTSSTDYKTYIAPVATTALDSSSSPIFPFVEGYNTLKSKEKNKDGSYVGIDISNTITALGNTPSGSRKPNDENYTFNLSLYFTDVYSAQDKAAEDIYPEDIYTNGEYPEIKEQEAKAIEKIKGKVINNVSLIEKISDKEFKVDAKKVSTSRLKRIIYGWNLATTGATFKEDSTGKMWMYRPDGTVEDVSSHFKNHPIYSSYVANLSNLNLTQTVTCKTHYGTAKSNTYSNDSKEYTDGKSGEYQSGGYSALEAKNTFTFYPYHVMQIDTQTKFNQYIDAAGNKKADATQENKSNNQVYVLGEELRQLNCYSYGGVSFSSGSVYNETTDTMNIVNQVNSKGKKSGKIQISSEQWSTHARATAATNGMQNCVLPGGASLTLTIPKDNRQTVTVTTYTPLLAGNGLDQVKATGSTGSMPTSLDTSAHENLIKSVANGLESLNVKQYTIDGTVMDDSGEVIELPEKNVWDTDKGELSAPSENTQSKYYFRDDGDLDKDNKAIDGLYASNKNVVTDGEANTGDLDTSVYDKSTGNINIGSTTTKYYTFYMNRVGEVYCISDSTIDGAAKKANILGKDGDKVAYLDSTTLKPVIVADGIILDIAKKTDIVNQLYTQLEEGTGKDSSAYWSDSNGAWYYEAFDGITIAHMSTDIQVGFIDSYERTSVLDPKLTPSASSKGDILEDYTYSQFKMADHSLLYGTPNKIGEYKVGGTTYDITVPDLSSLFVSDIFIIPNATVQDLK